MVPPIKTFTINYNNNCKLLVKWKDLQQQPERHGTVLVYIYRVCSIEGRFLWLWISFIFIFIICNFKL